eukprot:359311-Chlamydomonas_euryale.AAC.3
MCGASRPEASDIEPQLNVPDAVQTKVAVSEDVWPTRRGGGREEESPHPVASSRSAHPTPSSPKPREASLQA